MSIGIVFRHPPYGTSTAREGLDTLLSLSNFSEDINVYFLQEGLLNLLIGQVGIAILQKNQNSAFKLLSLCGIKNCYISTEDHAIFNINTENLVVPTIQLSKQQLLEKLSLEDKILTF